MSKEKSAPQFVDLLTYEQCPTSASATRRGSLIKGQHIVCKGSEKIEVDCHDEGEPTVITHRNGDTITGIEFVCPCGRSTMVSLEY
jgi:hypothetical protein